MALGEISEMEARWRRTRSFKAREFLWPQPRPLMLTRWLLHRARRGRAARQRRILPQQAEKPAFLMSHWARSLSNLTLQVARPFRSSPPNAFTRPVEPPRFPEFDAP